MKRFFLLSLFGLAVSHPAFGQPLDFAGNTFEWTGTETFLTAPQIDATNFVVDNGATFGVDLTTANLDAFSTVLFQTSDTLNYTNKGIMIGIPGFDFENYPDDPPPPQPGVPFSNMASTFANINDGSGGGAINCTSILAGPSPGSGPLPESFPGLAMVKVNATNILDSGSISMDNAGLVDFRGNNLDLRRGQFSMSSQLGAAPILLLDWGSGGFGTNVLGWDTATLTPTTADSSLFFDVNFFEEEMVLNNSTSYFESLTGDNNGSGTIVWRAIFLQDSSPANVTHNIYFDSSIVGNGAFHIEWVGTVPDPVTGALSTNYFYLSDVPANRRTTNYLFAPTQPTTQAQPFGEFTLSESTIRQNLGTPTPPGFVNPGWPTLVTNNDFAYINALLSGFVVTNEVFGGSVTNLPGRVQLTASQSMNLANTRVSGPNYVLLSSPVDFEGNSNSVISTPFADLDLGVTNDTLAISNLLVPAVSTWTGVSNAPNAVLGGIAENGGIQAWSGSFLFGSTNFTVTLSNGVPVATNAVAVTNDVRLLLVNSAIQPTGPALQQNVTLHTGANLVISDDLNIYNNFTSDAQVLTVTTNGPGAFNGFGQINLFSPDIFWSTALTNLQYLTNWGEISTLNQTFFAGNVSSPLSDLNAATPYQAFINHGTITDQGVFIRADAFENSGVIAESAGGGISAGGSIDIGVSGNAIATNGSFLAPGGYVSITADSLIASNGVIDAGGGPLTLTMTSPCFLSDGYLFGNQFAHATNSVLPNVVTNGNIWVTSGGIQIPFKPPTGDLLGTTITNFALTGASANKWPGNDQGINPQGFADNLAVGRMILNANSISEFEFVPANANGNNALYVDSIEFQGNATNTDAHGNPLSVAIEPGMNIYYAQAIENGESIAEKINGKFGAGNLNGGKFYWVSNYAGVYSSTNILYPDNNTYIFNEALAISPDINSGGPDGSGITNGFHPNSDNPYPIPTNMTYDITVVAPQPCGSGGGGSGDPGTNSPNTNALPILGHLVFPLESPAQTNSGSSNTVISFSVAAGSYNGLFYDTNAVTPSSSGYFSATVTSKGSFTAKLQLGSGDYSFSGVFDGSGSAAINNVSRKGLPTLSVYMQLVNNDHITGSVSSSAWTVQLQADRAAFGAKNGTSSAGKDTLLLPSYNGNSTAATGEGFGTANISTAGAVQLSGTLPDGTKITQKSALSKNGVWPAYSSLYGGSGVFIGWMQCTNQIDVGGSAVWEMPAGAGRLYTAGLTNQIDVVGSRVQGSVGFSGSGAAILSGAGLESSLTNQVVVFGKTVESANKALKLSVNPQTGLFNGSLVDPNSNQKLSFQGALLERSGIGGGFFLNAEQSGKVYFGPTN